MFNVQVIRPACYYVHAYNYFQFFIGIHGEAGVTRLKVFIVKYLSNHHSFLKLPTLQSHKPGAPLPKFLVFKPMQIMRHDLVLPSGG